jgi:aryl-alcohol dehydrogenase-like predicted oxidoreductase
MKLGLGTAQFGLNYGISNIQGKTPMSEVINILDVAKQAGMRIIDTAPLYGTSEKVLGSCLQNYHGFKIVTKTPQFKKNFIIPEDAQYLTDIFYRSLENLKQSSIYGLLVHDVNDLLSKNGHLLVESVVRLKEQGLVEKIGVSVYTGKQIDQVLDRYKIDLIQVPINVLDQRLILSKHLQKLKQHGVEIHARSVFLQGLLLMLPEHMGMHFKSVTEHICKYHLFLRSYGLSPVQGALAFVNQQKEIDSVLVGVCSRRELIQIIDSLNYLSELDYDFSSFSHSEEQIINPTMWKF